MSDWELSLSLEGLQHMDPSFGLVADMLRLLSRRVRPSSAFSPDRMCQCLFHLRGLGGETEAGRRILSALVKASRNHGGPAESPPSEWSLACGAMSLGVWRDEVSDKEELMEIMRKYISAYSALPRRPDEEASSPRVLSPRALGMSIYGLRGGSVGAGGVLRELLPHVRQAVVARSLSPRDVAMIVFGLKGSTSEPEVKALLSLVGSAMFEFARSPEKVRLSLRESGMILIGLQNMDTNAVEVQAILALLQTLMLPGSGFMASKPALKKDTVDSQGVSMSLFGLRRFPTDMPVVTGILRRLAPVVSSSAHAFTRRERYLALRGLGNMEPPSLLVTEMKKALAESVLSDGIKEAKQGLTTLAAQTWMPLLVGFFLLKEQLPALLTIDLFV